MNSYITKAMNKHIYLLPISYKICSTKIIKAHSVSILNFLSSATVCRDFETPKHAHTNFVKSIVLWKLSNDPSTTPTSSNVLPTKFHPKYSKACKIGKKKHLARFKPSKDRPKATIKREELNRHDLPHRPSVLEIRKKNRRIVFPPNEIRGSATTGQWRVSIAPHNPPGPDQSRSKHYF